MELVESHKGAREKIPSGIKLRKLNLGMDFKRHLLEIKESMNNKQHRIERLGFAIDQVQLNHFLDFILNQTISVTLENEVIERVVTVGRRTTNQISIVTNKN